MTAFFTDLTLAAALVVGALAGPAQDVKVQKVTLVATDYSFAPSTIHAVAGRPLEITLVNKGSHVHGLRLVLSFGDVPFPENVPPGFTQSATFDELGSPGTYRFYCPVEDHDSRGMHGAIVIEPSK